MDPSNLFSATGPARAAPSPAESLPARLAGAPLDVVKLAAAVLMVLDHVNTILLNGGATWMWRLGRIAFPLFCFVLACHLVRGADPSRYVRTLLLVGIATQPIFAAAFAFGTKEANILFTLSAGVVLATALARAGALWPHAVLGFGSLLVLTLPAWAKTGVDFGLGGILLPAALTLALLRWRAYGAWLPVILFGLNAHAWRPEGETWMEAASFDALSAGIGGTCVIAAALLVRGRPRFLPAYVLHAFYPGHLLVLALLRAAGFGVG